MAKDLKLTFAALKKRLKPYQKLLAVQTDKATAYELVGTKDYTTTSLKTGKTHKKHGAYFAGIVIRKDFVGFQFMPPYAEKGFMKPFSDKMKKRLKGKTCFHYKKPEEVDKEFDKLVKAGYRSFKKQGLI